MWWYHKQHHPIVEFIAKATEVHKLRIPNKQIIREFETW